MLQFADPSGPPKPSTPSQGYGLGRGNGGNSPYFTENRDFSEISGNDIEVKYSESRENEYVRQVANISKAEQFLSWKPNLPSLLNICKSVYDTEIGV